jgi:hypothetical protein
MSNIAPLLSMNLESASDISILDRLVQDVNDELEWTSVFPNPVDVVLDSLILYVDRTVDLLRQPDCKQVLLLVLQMYD